MRERAGEGTPGTGRVWSAVARGIVFLRYLILPAWVVLAVLAATRLPSIFDAGSGSIGDLVPNDSAALSVERQANQTFGLPLLSRTTVVASEPGGLSPRQVSRAVDLVTKIDEGRDRGAPNLLGALPLVNVDRLSAGNAPRTMAIYLFIRPSLPEGGQTKVAEAFSSTLSKRAGIGTVDVTGPVPARYHDATIAEDNLTWVELATLLLVVGILGFYFRAPGIPLLGLATVGIAYLISGHVLGWLGQTRHFSVPQEVEPVMVALLFGVLTDYVVFFSSGFRARLEQGVPSREAAQAVTAELLPVVLTAGLMIAGATLTLMLSGMKFLEVFGPGLTVSVIVGVAVALTVVPAALAGMGPLLLKPGRGTRAGDEAPHSARESLAVRAAARFPAAIAMFCILILLAGASGLRNLRLGDPVMQGLPASTQERQGFERASAAFSPGVLGPTMVVVRGNDIASRRDALAALESRLRTAPGVSAVVGPADQPVEHPYGVVVSKDGSAGRFLLMFDSDPEGANAADSLSWIQSHMPSMLAAAGIPNAKVGFAGDTAITQELTTDTAQALLRVAPVALLILLILVWALLRTLGAPLYLVAASCLVVAAAQGITVYLFQDLLGYGEIAFFVPVATAILLVALGSDYNVFLIGRIWLEARRRELRSAVRSAGSRAARAIAVAGVILALSFAATAIIPILAFREIAFAMAVGLLLDAFIARPLLIPALVTIFERGNENLGESERERRREAPAADASTVGGA